MEKNIQQKDFNKLFFDLKNAVKAKNFLSAFNIYKCLKENNCSVKIENKEDDEEDEKQEYNNNNNICNNNIFDNKNKYDDDFNFSVFI